MRTSIKPTGMLLVLEQVRLSQRYFGECEFVTAAALLTRAKHNLKRLNKWGDNPISVRVEALLRLMLERARDEQAAIAKIEAEERREDRLANSQFGVGA